MILGATEGTWIALASGGEAGAGRRSTKGSEGTRGQTSETQEAYEAFIRCTLRTVMGRCWGRLEYGKCSE